MPSAEHSPAGGALRSGDLVEVRSREEILATLDARGMLQDLPFMPEMLRFCGRRMVVDKIAHKTCDTIKYTGIRRLPDAVHLRDAYCDGSAHGGCEAECLLYWKEAWLKAVEPSRRRLAVVRPATGPQACCDPEGLQRATRRSGEADAETHYRCQITELLHATQPLSWWNPAPYLKDIRSGNWSIRHVFRVLLLACLRRIIPWGIGYRALIGLYDWLATRFGMSSYEDVTAVWGSIPKHAPTPSGGAPVGVGEWVRVRPRAEIVATLNTTGRNRGLHFDAEMVGYCGGKFQVRRIVRRLIDENSGRLLEMKNPCVALEGVVCRSEYSDRRYMCPRALPIYWRPLWLEKVEHDQHTGP